MELFDVMSNEQLAGLCRDYIRVCFRKYKHGILRHGRHFEMYYDMTGSKSFRDFNIDYDKIPCPVMILTEELEKKCSTYLSDTKLQRDYDELVYSIELLDFDFHVYITGLYKLYTELDRKEVYALLSIDADRCIALGISPDDEVRRLLKIDSLLGSDFDVSSNLRLVIKKNKKIWKMVREIGARDLRK